MKTLHDINQEIKKLEKIEIYSMTSTQEEKLMTLKALRTQTEDILKMIEEFIGIWKYKVPLCSTCEKILNSLQKEFTKIEGEQE